MTNWLSEGMGSTIFLFAHVPLFAIVIALIASKNEKTRSRSRLAISVFLVVHGILHALFIGHEAYEFTSLSSDILIFGGAALGFVYLIPDFGKVKR